VAQGKNPEFKPQYHKKKKKKKSNKTKLLCQEAGSPARKTDNANIQIFVAKLEVP
jgi:hypothetical protein